MAAYPILEITNAPKVLKNNGSVTSRAQKFLCFTLVGHMRCYVYFCSALILLCAFGPNVSILLSHKMAFAPNTETLNFPTQTLNYTRNNRTWNQFVHQEGTAIIMQLQHLLCSCTPTSSKSTKPYMCISNRFPIFDMLFKPTGEKPSFFNALRMSCCLFFSSCHHNTSNPYTG